MTANAREGPKNLLAALISRTHGLGRRPRKVERSLKKRFSYISQTTPQPSGWIRHTTGAITPLDAPGARKVAAAPPPHPSQPGATPHPTAHPGADPPLHHLTRGSPHTQPPNHEAGFVAAPRCPYEMGRVRPYPKPAGRSRGAAFLLST